MRLYLSFTNRRGNEGSAGLASGSTVHARGWNAGVRVRANGPKDGRDSFDIYMTGGSGGAGSDRLLGTVMDTPNGPVFEPTFDPNNFLGKAKAQP